MVFVRDDDDHILKLCVACGEVHADVETATRVGISYVARECSWSLRYPGKQAFEVIEELEGRTRGDDPVVERVPAAPGQSVEWVDLPRSESPPQDLGVDPASLAIPPRRPGEEPGPADLALPEDPTGKTEMLCPVCGGDAEIEDPENPGSFVPCARCENGRIVVSP